MRTRHLVALAAILPVLSLQAQTLSPPRAPDTTARVIDRLFDAYRDNAAPGCAVAVSRNGQSLYEHAYGMANLETGTPNSVNSIFHVASVSKQFTAMAVLLLERDGRLSLDDDIRKHLPEIPDYGQRITIRNLLNHTSGLRDQWELLALARGRFEENRITEADVMDILPRQKAPNFAPGAEYLYSNTGFTLAGVIVRRVSGKSLREFADERIFRPLGMAHTHFHDSYTMLVPGRTSAYAPATGGWRVSIPNYDTYGATSLYTTVGDLQKWQANFDRPVVGDAALVARMHVLPRLTTGDTSAYALGLGVARFRGALEISHGGADAGYRSWLGRYPDHGLSIAIACNASTANTTALARGIADAYLGPALTATPPVVPPKAISLPAGALERRAGAYVQPTTLQVVELVMRDGQLRAGRGANAPVLMAVADNRFRVGETPVEFAFGTGDRAGFDRVVLAGGRPTTFERPAPAVTTKAALAAFAGDYFSEEVDARYRVTAGDTTIALRTGTMEPMPARPVFADAFLAGGYTIVFQRRGREVSGFEVTNGRMRRVKFTRAASNR